MRILHVISILSWVLCSSTAIAHEGHGTGVGHALHHMIWLLAAVITPLILLGIYYLRDR